MKFFNKLFLFFLTFFTTVSLNGQDTIYFENPSFEDIPRHSHTPKSWKNCGSAGESPPDIQPDFTFKVSNPAYNGNTYLGMVVRDNGTWESVGTELNHPLKKDSCYQFEIKLSRSLSYLSVSSELNKPANYITPTKLRIWGGANGFCEKVELLAQSEEVIDEYWYKYRFYIHPKKGDVNFIILEAFYGYLEQFTSNGNLLLDDASPFVLLPSHKDSTHLHEVPIYPLSSQNNAIKSTINTQNYSTKSTPKPTSKSRSCQFIEQLADDNINQAFIDLANYAQRISDTPDPWTITISGEGHEKYIRQLSFRVRRLGLRSYFKIIEFNDISGNVELVCRESIGDKIIGVYY